MSEPGPNCRSDHSPLTGTVAHRRRHHQDCENRVHVQNQARSSPENDFPFASRGRGLPVIRAITLTLPSEARPGEDSVTSGCDRACSLVIHDNDAIGGDCALRHLERRRNRAIDKQPFSTAQRQHGTSHLPYAKPPLVSSSGPPPACMTPSRVMNSITITFLMTEFLRYLVIFMGKSLASLSKFYERGSGEQQPNTVSRLLL